MRNTKRGIIIAIAFVISFALWPSHLSLPQKLDGILGHLLDLTNVHAQNYVVCTGGSCASNNISGWSSAGSAGYTSAATFYTSLYGLALGTVQDARGQLIIARACTVRAMYLYVSIRTASTAAVYSSGNTVVTLMVSGSAGTNVITSNTIFTQTPGGAAASYSDTSHADAVTAGQVIGIRVATGTFSTPPTGVDLNVSLACYLN